MLNSIINKMESVNGFLYFIPEYGIIFKLEIPENSFLEVHSRF